jgi:hypothetical protein
MSKKKAKRRKNAKRRKKKKKLKLKQKDMIAYNWDCRRVEAYPEFESGGATYPDVVFWVTWIVTGVSDVLDPEGIPYTSFWENTIAIDTSNITNFIPFSELTNEISVGWVHSTMGAETVVFWEETVAYSIENLINPVSIPLIIGE